MMLPKRMNYYTPANLQPGTNLLLGANPRFDQFDRSYPWEEMLIFINFTCNATAPSSMTIDSIMNFVRNVNLSINDGIRPRSVVNCSSMFLLEYAAKLGINLDAATLAVLVEMNKATPSLTASNLYQLCFRIPFVHPMVAEPLRTRCLLDVHHHVANPVLALDFSSAVQMYGAGTIDTITAEVVVLGRDMPADLDDKIMKDGGYLKYDLLETAYQVPLGTAGEQRFDIPTPGWYSGLLLRQYLGGATVTRNEITNAPSSANPGAESKWRILRGGSFAPIEFRAKHLRAINDWTGVLNSQSQTSSPAFMSKILGTNYQYQQPSSVYLDFMTDGLESASEFGSLLNCNAPSNSIAKTQLVCTDVKSVATNASTLYLGGHRFYDDDGLVRKWQALRAA